MGDIIILGILIVLTVLGYKKGFLRTLTGVISIILSFVLAISFCSHVEAYIKTTPVYDTIYKNIEEKIAPEENEENNDVDEYKLNLPREMVKDIKESVIDSETQLAMTLTDKIANVAVKILSIVCIFLAVRILIMLIMFCFGFIRKLPFIGWFDRILGALFGFLRGLLVVYLLLVIVMVSATFNSDNVLIKSINHSEFAKVMYNNNVFLDFVKND